MSDDTFALLALRLIDEHGTDVTVRKTSRTPATPSKPWEGNEVNPTDVVVKGAFGYQFEGETPNSLQVRGEEEVIFVASEDTNEILEDFDFVLFESETWKVLQVETYRSTDVRVLYVIKAVR